MRTNYISSQGTQFPQSWTSWPKHIGESHLTLFSWSNVWFPLWLQCPWGHHTHLVLHMCTSPSVNLQWFCIPASSQGVLYVIPMYFSLPGTILTSHWTEPAIHLSAFSCQKCTVTHSHGMGCYCPSQGLGYVPLLCTRNNKLLRQTPACQPPWLNTLGCYTKA